MTTTPTSADAFSIRDAGVADAPAMLALHRSGFGSRWTMADWSHRYGEDPRRRTRLVGAFDRDGRCHAAFGGVLLPCRLGDGIGIACRGSDVVVDPRLRDTTAGPRLLLRICEAFVEGLAGRDVAMVFGFPNPGLGRTLVRHCRFEIMADVAWLTRASDGCGPGPSSLPVTVTRELPDDIDVLIAPAAGSTDVGLVRDRAYLQWRYEQNALGRYVVATARSTAGIPRGAVIVRCDAPHAESVVVVEWLVQNDDADAITALLSATAAIAREAKRPWLVTCVAGTAPAFATLQQVHGFRVVVSPYQFAFRSYVQSITRRFLFDHWRLSAGDLDFM